MSALVPRYTCSGSLTTRFSRDLVLERYWYLRQALLSGPDGRSSRVEAALGLSADEPELTPLEGTLVAGRWFAAGEGTGDFTCTSS